ncbi:SRPBCC domain-containing protein [Fulvivirga ligni]|uniref:SRPBCC domain-containing protein n=1 Tax=Fulvivirga ligni TaxID=2904246 RepID=UPI001F375FC0|nr:SRPBCC domain-containing protein [Fulvivirga ligni]UII24257.1 SRPBCC domain-containing protein [Fulvivirga ligni]
MDDISKRSLKMTRKYNASAELLWKVLITPEYIGEWWGPHGFTNTIHKMDVREGGKWEFIMHGPDGTDYENEYVYSTIIPFKKIVLDHLKTPKFSIVISIHEEGEQTTVEWCNIFDSIPTKEEAVRAFKADVGLEQNLQRLADHLNKPEKV